MLGRLVAELFARLGRVIDDAHAGGVPASAVAHEAAGSAEAVLAGQQVRPGADGDAAVVVEEQREDYRRAVALQVVDDADLDLAIALAFWAVLVVGAVAIAAARLARDRLVARVVGVFVAERVAVVVARHD